MWQTHFNYRCFFSPRLMCNLNPKRLIHKLLHCIAFPCIPLNPPSINYLLTFFRRKNDIIGFAKLNKNIGWIEISFWNCDKRVLNRIALISSRIVCLKHFEM